MAILALTLALAAQAAPQPYTAQGDGWTLTIAGGRMRYAPRDGHAIEVHAPPARTSEIDREYRTSRLTVTIAPGAACTERVSNRRYADTVFLHAGGQRLMGCGGAALAVDDLTDTSWQFVEINGASVMPDMAGYSLDFGSDGILGYSRCNRFSARFERAEGALRFTWIGSTMSRCLPPHDDHDIQLRRIFSGRAGPVRVSLPDANTLLLTADISVRLRRVDTGR